MKKPKIICFCGSSRFTADMAVLMWECEKMGNICIGLHLMPSGYGEAKGYGKEYHHLGELEGVEKQMDELHLRKIDLADMVYIININGYIGESTRNEINYAEKLGKPIEYLVKPTENQTCPHCGEDELGYDKGKLRCLCCKKFINK